MATIVLLLATLGCFRVSAGVRYNQHINNNVFNGYKCKSSDVVFTLSTDSLIVCSVTCSLYPNCKNLFYKTTTGMCTGCDVFYTATSQLVSDGGTLYYVPIDGDPACNTPKKYFRLCDGGGTGVSDPKQGRIELFYNRQWWAVCNDCWEGDCQNDDVHNLKTVCNTFGLTGGEIFANDYFGTNTKTLLIDNVECVQTEDTILDCPHIGPPNTIACDLHEAVGVSCS